MTSQPDATVHPDRHDRYLALCEHLGVPSPDRDDHSFRYAAVSGIGDYEDSRADTCPTLEDACTVIADQTLMGLAPGWIQDLDEDRRIEITTTVTCRPASPPAPADAALAISYSGPLLTIDPGRLDPDDMDAPDVGDFDNTPIRFGHERPGEAAATFWGYAVMNDAILCPPGITVDCYGEDDDTGAGVVFVIYPANDGAHVGISSGWTNADEFSIGVGDNPEDPALLERCARAMVAIVNATLQKIRAEVPVSAIPAGIIWPADPDGFAPPAGWSWIERDDDAAVYDSDEHAAQALLDAGLATAFRYFRRGSAIGLPVDSESSLEGCSLAINVPEPRAFR